MSKAFSEWVTKRNERLESMVDGKKELSAEETQHLTSLVISDNLFMIAYELDRLCDILERKGR